MNLLSQLVGTVLLALLTSPFFPSQSIDNVDPDAVKSAEAFLSLLDQGRWEDAFESADLTLSKRIFMDVYPRHIGNRGKFQSRKFVASRPKGEISIGDEQIEKIELEFEGSFEKVVVKETVTLINGPKGEWRVRAYEFGPKE